MPLVLSSPFLFVPKLRHLPALSSLISPIISSRAHLGESDVPYAADDREKLEESAADLAAHEETEVRKVE
jgi:hypothetical protein